MAFSYQFLIALLSSTLPAIFWLWFWLKEDRARPEPKRRIIFSFFCGMLAVILVLPIEKFLYSFLGPALSIFTLFSWAAAEEILKFLATYISSFWKNKAYDEPLDATMYLISAALGFSALENAFFLLNVLNSGPITQSIMSGNMRFIGASLLHTICSATIGVFMGLGFYKNKENKRAALSTGILFAIFLHTLFNYLIIHNEKHLFFIFGGVWVLILLLLFLIEKIKTITNTYGKR